MLGVDFGVDRTLDSEVGASEPKRFPLVMSLSNFAPRTVDVGDRNQFLFVTGIVPVPWHIAIDRFKIVHTHGELLGHTVAWFGVDMEGKVQSREHFGCWVFWHGGVEQTPVALLTTFDVLSFR